MGAKMSDGAATKTGVVAVQGIEIGLSERAALKTDEKYSLQGSWYKLGTVFVKALLMW